MKALRMKHPLAMVAWLISFLLIISIPISVMAMPMSSEKVDVIIAFHQQPGPNEQALVRAAGGSLKYTYHLVPAIAASLPAAAIEALARNPKVLRIEPDVEVHTIADSYPWGITQIGADAVHASGNKGFGVKVAIIDTGVDYKHPDLAGRYAGGYDFVNKDNDPMDDNNHGTHVAGTVAAIINDAGVIGVAPEVSIYALKVLNRRGSGNFSDVIAALEWCADNGIQITNNSFGSSGDPGLTVRQAYDNSYGQGVLHVGSAGNSGTSDGSGDTVGYPAKYESVIAVAATDSNNIRASFSSTGPAVELSAPGVSILSTIRDGKYATYNGTSMASPHVAGTAALVIASGITGPDAVRSKLQSTATDLGATNWYGYGLVNAAEAAVNDLPPVEPPPVVTITSPENGASVSGLTTIRAEARSDPNVILKVDFYLDDAILGSDAESSDGWSFVWDTATSVDGTYNIRAVATDTADLTGSDEITVIVNNNLDSVIRIADLSGSSKTVNPATWQASVTATVSPVFTGAVVTGIWSNGTSGSATTGGDGRCTFTSDNLNKKISSITFTVTNIVLDGYIFEPDSSDSNSDSTVIVKP